MHTLTALCVFTLAVCSECSVRDEQQLHVKVNLMSTCIDSQSMHVAERSVWNDLS